MANSTNLRERCKVMAKAYKGRLARKKSIMPIDRRDSLHRNQFRLRLHTNRYWRRRRSR
jgi:hypothetical protein